MLLIWKNLHFTITIYKPIKIQGKIAIKNVTSTVGNTFWSKVLIVGVASKSGPKNVIFLESESMDVRVRKAKIGKSQNIVNALRREMIRSNIYITYNNNN